MSKNIIATICLIGITFMFTEAFAESCKVSAEAPWCYTAYQKAKVAKEASCQIANCTPEHGCRTAKHLNQILKEEKQEEVCRVEVDYTTQCICPF